MADKPASLDAELVQQFVGAPQQLDCVKQMLDEHPTLLNAAFDWDSGD